MEKNSLVSVLLPFHNAEKTLKESIESICRQTLYQFELILVDNASTDTSGIIAQHFSQNDPRVHLVKEAEKGIVPALNTGLKYCKGAFIARMDADDISLPSRLEIQYKLLSDKPHIDLCASKVIHQSKEEKTLGYSLYVDWINELLTHQQISLKRFMESPLAHPSVMFRRSCVEKWGAYRNGDFPEDYELWLRWLSQGAQIEKADMELLIWHDARDRLSRTDPRYHPDAFFRMKSAYLIQWLQQNNPFHPNIVIWGAGKLAKQRAALLEQLGLTVLFYIDVDKNKCRADNVILHTELGKPGEYFILSLAGNRGVGKKIQAFLESRNHQEGKDFILAAGL